MVNDKMLSDRVVFNLQDLADDQENSIFSSFNPNTAEAKEIHSALQSGDLDKVKRISAELISFLPPDVRQKIDTKVLDEKFEEIRQVHRAVKNFELYNRVTDKKKTEALNQKEQDWLNFVNKPDKTKKSPMDKAVEFMQKKYPTAFAEGPLTQDEQTKMDDRISELKIDRWANPEKYADPALAPQSAEVTSKPSDKQPTPTNDVQLPQQNELPLTEAQEKQAAQETAEDREEFNDEATANLGDKMKDVYGAGGDDQFADPKSFDWFTFRKEAMWDPLQKAASEKTMADMALAIFTSVILDSPAKMLANWAKQRHDIKKEDKKTQKTNRDNAIDSNLKQRGLNRNDLISDLAHKSKSWILDDSVVKNLPSGSLSKVQKAHIKKYKFGQSLPKTKEGDFDFGKFSPTQLKKYQDYVMMYATLPEWRNDTQEKMGVKLTEEELANQAKIAHQMKIKKPNILLDGEQKDQVLDDLKDAVRMVGAPRRQDGSLAFSRFTLEDVKEYESVIEKERRDFDKLTPDSVSVKGKLDNPIIKRTEDGKTWTIDGKTLEEIEEESKKMRRTIRLLAEQRIKQQENERAVQLAKENAASRQQPVHTNVNDGRGGRTQ